MRYMERSRGFTLVELMVTVAIVAILCSIALPSYSGYAARAQVSEAVDLLWAAKSPFTEHYGSYGTWPASAEQVLGTTSGRYTASIAILGTPGDQNIEIMATMVSFGIATEVRSGTLVLSTADGGGSWKCAPGGPKPIPAADLPGACR